MKHLRLLFFHLIFIVFFPASILTAASSQSSFSSPGQTHAGFIDIQGKIAIPLLYDSVGDFQEGFSWVQKNGKFGFIDPTGKIVIEIKFDYAGNFKGGLATVETGGKFGIIDKTGTFIVPANFDRITYFSEDFAPAEQGKLWGFIDKKGKWIIKPQYHQVGGFSEGLASVSQHGIQFHFIDKNGTTVVSDPGCQSDSSPGFVSGFAKFDRTSGAPSIHWEVYINKSGEIVFEKTTQNTMSYIPVTEEPPLEQIDGEPITHIGINLLKNKNQELPFTEGLSLLKDSSGFGFGDVNGNVVIKTQFENADNFSSGFARVKYKNKWGFIDHQGRWVVKPIYSEAENFFGEFAYVKKDDKNEGFVDSKGNFFSAPYLTRYNASKKFGEGLMSVREIIK